MLIILPQINIMLAAYSKPDSHSAPRRLQNFGRIHLRTISGHDGPLRTVRVYPDYRSLVSPGIGPGHLVSALVDSGRHQPDITLENRSLIDIVSDRYYRRVKRSLRVYYDE